MCLTGFMCSQPSGSPASTAVSDILFAKSRLSFPAFSYVPSLWHEPFSPWNVSPGFGGILVARLLLLPHWAPSLSALPFKLWFSPGSIPHPFLFSVCISCLFFCNMKRWRSGTLLGSPGLGSVEGSQGGAACRSKLSYRQADPQACSDSRPSSRRLQGWRGAGGLVGGRGGSWDAVEPESTSSGALEERGEISWTCFDGQGQKQEMRVKLPASKRRIEAWLEGQRVRQGGWAPAMWSLG